MVHLWQKQEINIGTILLTQLQTSLRFHQFENGILKKILIEHFQFLTIPVKAETGPKGQLVQPPTRLESRQHLKRWPCWALPLWGGIGLPFVSATCTGHPLAYLRTAFKFWAPPKCSLWAFCCKLSLSGMVPRPFTMLAAHLKIVTPRRDSAV